jgi:hypothetical protein
MIILDKTMILRANLVTLQRDNEAFFPPKAFK